MSGHNRRGIKMIINLRVDVVSVELELGVGPGLDDPFCYVRDNLRRSSLEPTTYSSATYTSCLWRTSRYCRTLERAWREVPPHGWCTRESKKTFANAIYDEKTRNRRGREFSYDIIIDKRTIMVLIYT